MACPLSEFSETFETIYPFASGNSIVLLTSGDEAFPSMLGAIEASRVSIHMSSYQFVWDVVGEQFLTALEQALSRGVEVRLLLDAIGTRLAKPSIISKLRRSRIRFALFNPVRSIFRVNCRYHRKLLVVDRSVAFTGGLNIRQDHLVKIDPLRPTEDMHFRISGPLVSQLQEVFRGDWKAATGEILVAEHSESVQSDSGSVTARAVMSGPGKFREICSLILGAIRSASESIRIMSPYFIPDRELISALVGAVRRGVKIEIVLPQKAPHWARLSSAKSLRRLISEGCRVVLSTGHFDHTKLCLIDRSWLLIGSANIDGRSLKLNMELDVECWDENLASRLRAVTDGRVASGYTASVSYMQETMRHSVIARHLLEILAPQL
jgi:cardiolipin synthase A/B